MQNLEFEWDDDKPQENLLKHPIDFSDAIQIFFDPWAVEEFDDREEYGDNRFRVIGLFKAGWFLLPTQSAAGRSGSYPLVPRAAKREEHMKIRANAKKLPRGKTNWKKIDALSDAEIKRRALFKHGAPIT